MKTNRKALLPVIALLAALLVLLALLFSHDNKYQAPPPYGKSGVISLTQDDLTRNTPVYLIDGWLLSDSRVENRPTYVGEFSNLQRGDLTADPHGQASYCLTLRYDGAPTAVAVSFPRLPGSFSLFLDGVEIDRGSGNGWAVFLLEAGDHLLRLETESHSGYYSGLYFVPALGRPELLMGLRDIQTLAYSVAISLSLLLALFTLVLWRRDRRGMEFCLGMLCCCFALYLSHYFWELFALPLPGLWQMVEGASLYGLIFCALRLTALAVDGADSPRFLRVQRAMWIIPLLLGALYLLIPVFPWAVYLHGRAKDIYLLFVFVCAVLLTVRGGQVKKPFILAGGVVFSAGLMANLWLANRFEPIRFFWQFEWCGLLMTAIFAAMMVLRNRQIRRENDQLTNHLEQQVAQRTAALQLVLSERKDFFSDMAHDLKAPLRSTQGFIRAIRQNNTGVDGELLRYLDQVEQKQQEMSRRVQGLNTITQLDKIEDAPQRISIRALLSELYATHKGDAEVSSIHLTVTLPEEDCWIVAQQDKLDILFENLIYNAIRATPPEGYIRLSGEKKQDTVLLTVSDTGRGIPPEELPHIFRRFYVGAENRETGSGLGLYIARTIVEELGGTITAASTVGVGSEFIIELPQARTRKTDRTQ